MFKNSLNNINRVLYLKNRLHNINYILCLKIVHIILTVYLYLKMYIYICYFIYYNIKNIFLQVLMKKK